MQTRSGIIAAAAAALIVARFDFPLYLYIFSVLMPLYLCPCTYTPVLMPHLCIFSYCPQLSGHFNHMMSAPLGTDALSLMLRTSSATCVMQSLMVTRLIPRVFFFCLHSFFVIGSLSPGPHHHQTLTLVSLEPARFNAYLRVGLAHCLSKYSSIHVELFRNYN